MHFSLRQTNLSISSNQVPTIGPLAAVTPFAPNAPSDHELRLTLTHLRCEQSNEPDDEIFLRLRGDYLDGSSKLDTQIPHATYWVFTNGTQQNEPQALFSGPLFTGLMLTLAVIEQDAHGILRRMTFLNDLIGEVRIRALGTGECSVESGRHAAVLPGEYAPAQHWFRLNGAGARYVLGLEVQCFRCAEDPAAGS